MRAGRRVWLTVVLVSAVSGVAVATSTLVVSGVVVKAGPKPRDAPVHVLPTRNVGLYAFPKKDRKSVV